MRKPEWRRWTPMKIEPLVVDATRTVRCLACGYAHDSDADTDAEALDEIAAMHDKAHSAALRVAWSKSVTPVSPGGTDVPEDAPSLSSVSRAASTGAGSG